MIGGTGGKSNELHRFQIAEGIEQHGKRRRLIGTYFVSSYEYSSAKLMMQMYLDIHYDLSKTLVISNSDGGPGYEKAAFDEIIGLDVLRHEHCRDRYHANRKVKERLGWADQMLVKEMCKAINKGNREDADLYLNTILATARNAKQEYNAKKYAAYLDRNWEYLIRPWKRGLKGIAKCLGTCESNHRIYGYRMKKQGRRWSQKGGAAMARLITAQKNNEFDKILGLPDEEYERRPEPPRGRSKRKKEPKPIQEGVKHGSIALDGPSSSAMGHLKRIMSCEREII